MTDSRIPARLALAAAFAFTPSAWSDSVIEDGFDELAEFRTEDVTNESTNDKFGAHVALVPGFMAVAAPFLNDPGSQDGGVFLFSVNAGAVPPVSFIKRMPGLEPDGDISRRGQALAGNGEWIAVAQNRDALITMHLRDQGGTNNWGIADVIEPPEDPTYRPATFASSSGEYPTIDIHGNLMVTSDYQGDLFNADGSAQIEDAAGFAFIYERSGDNWTLVARLDDPTQDLNDNEQFGRAVAIYDGINEDIVVVGAPSTDIDPNINRDVGEAFVFTRATGSNVWQLTKTLLGEGLDGRQQGDMFGRSVDVAQSTIVVGSNNGWNVASNAGSVHIFERDEGGPANWGETLEIGEGAFIDNYSSSIQLTGDQLIVGSPSGGTSRGIAYLYERNQDGPDAWGLVQELEASTSETADEFASGVSLLGGFAAIGDRGRDSRDGSASRSGSAYVFLDDLIFCDDFEED